VARSSNVYTSWAILQPDDNLVKGGGALVWRFNVGVKSLHVKRADIFARL